ncbi:nuclear pore complex protein Nup107 [Daktulosphaira vitifoliae]|uniref:nuclear pore complex protein Nup107 n=1 Tax=Daktulosphaira vitifoliae TaxID=58002 RepID=UPI0021AAC34A|nr:nuclear pore complex protein Nup107 [Daktulosphaira vitifoliae]
MEEYDQSSMFTDFDTSNNESVMDYTTDDITKLKIRKSQFNLSVSLTPGELTAIFDNTIAQQKSSSENCLYNQFLDVLKAFRITSPLQLLEILQYFIDICRETLDVLKDQNQNSNWLEQELNTWRLLLTLFQVQHLESEKVDKIISDRELSDALFKEDQKLKGIQRIVDWLEHCAAESMENEFMKDAKHFSDEGVAWPNTLGQLLKKQLIYQSSGAMVTQLDPDAPQRQNRSIHDLDQVDEDRLLAQVFSEIRCGRLEKAELLCCQYGQFWRSAIMEGWRLYHDPFYKNKEDHILSDEVLGNPNRDIWKSCAWKISSDPKNSAYWRATIGILCGNIDAVLPVCDKWEDILWAHLHTIVNVAVEDRIQTNRTNSIINLPEQYWEYKMNLDDIVAELKSNAKLSVRQEAHKPKRQIQQYFITNQFSELITTMENWVENSFESDSQFLRLLAHLVLIIRWAGIHHNEKSANSILQKYIEILIPMNDSILVAYYTSQLERHCQIDTYSKFLEKMNSPEQRKQGLLAGEKFLLPVEEITKQIVETVRHRLTKKTSGVDVFTEITSDDHQLISALDWIIYYPRQVEEAFVQINIVVRNFVAQGKIQAARLAFNKIQKEAIKLLINTLDIDINKLMKLDIPISGKTKSLLMEYLSYKCYLDAEEGFADWFHEYHQTKPTEPPKLSDNADYTKKLVYDHNMEVYKSSLESWKISIASSSQVVIEQLFNLLFFPGGWLVDHENDDEKRHEHFELLRTICIPKIFMLLHTILHSAEKYMDCIKLASYITDETNNFYRLFTQADLKKLFAKISESSICLMESSNEYLDPLIVLTD